MLLCHRHDIFISNPLKLDNWKWLLSFICKEVLLPVDIFICVLHSAECGCSPSVGVSQQVEGIIQKEVRYSTCSCLLKMSRDQ